MTTSAMQLLVQEDIGNILVLAGLLPVASALPLLLLTAAACWRVLSLLAVHPQSTAAVLSNTEQATAR